MHSRLDLPQIHLVLRQSYRLGAWEEEKGVGGFQGSVARRLDFLKTSVAFLSLIGKKSLNGLSPPSHPWTNELQTEDLFYSHLTNSLTNSIGS